MWGTVQEKVYETCMTDLDELEHRIRTEWAKLDHAVIAAAVRQWCRRLSVSVKAGGGNFEHCCFDFEIVFAAITATFLAVVDQSTSCTLIGRFRFNCSCHAVVILCFAIHGDCFIHK